MWFLLLSGLAGYASAAQPSAEQIAFFEKKIRPVLVEHCYQCHSADAAKKNKLKGQLQLDTRAGLLAGGESGVGIVPGKPDEGTLLAALKYDGFEMPPTGKLPANIVADFEKWIRMGAPDPRDGTSKPSTLVAEIDWDKARQFWAFQKPVKHTHPPVKNKTWPQKEIDHFILAKLENQKLQPVAPANKRELIRRATFDLIGLPPTTEEIEAFEKDDSPQAFQKVVERLLKSPHYGERWGRYWLDVARYADDKALAYPNPWPHAWRYRDWVVKALNDDMPYDRFLRLQLAGDLIPEPKTDYTQRLAGLGFQGLGAFYHKGSVPDQVIADELDDRIDTLGRGLLGLTLGCSRCHDHKYDPVPTRDYYALASAYNGASWSEVSMASPEVIARYNEGQRRIKEQDGKINKWLGDIGRREAEKQFANFSRLMQTAWRLNVLEGKGIKTSLAEIAKQEKLHPYYLGRFREFLKPQKKAEAIKRFVQLKAWYAHDDKNQQVAKYTDLQVPKPIVQIADQFQELAQASLQKQQAKKSNKQAEQLLKNLYLDKAGPLFADAANVEKQLLSDKEKPQLAVLRSELAKRKKDAPAKYPVAHGVAGGGKAMPVYIRGNVKNKGEVAQPGFLRILRGKHEPAGGKFTRLDLAEAICSPQNPLTARVIVNRVWQHHFGRGIVPTASNFGAVGMRPTHPELLDSLAVRFMENGWSIKWLHRELMLSATYRLSSQRNDNNLTIDPDNHMLWRYSPRRMDVEAWRDAILAVSGRLDRKMGGPAAGTTNTSHVRRSLYGMVSRRTPDKMMAAFDFPDANVSNARRDVTTVPQQQLFVLNSDFLVESAKALAARLEKAAAKDEDRIALAYRWAYGRAATADETKFNLQFLQLATENRGQDQLTPWQQLAQAILAANEFAWID